MSVQPDAFHDRAGPDWSPHDDLPAYALGLLDRDERATFEQHLVDCPLCQDEAPTFGDLAGQLARGLPPQAPPAGARERLRERARAESRPSDVQTSAQTPPQPEHLVQVDEPAPAPRRAALEPLPTSRVQHRPRRRRIRLASLGWGAALLFVLASGLCVGAWGATEPHASIGYEIQARLPGGQILPLAGTGAPSAKGRLFVVGGGRQAELAVDRLPPLREGRVYQLWLTESDQSSTTGGAFTVDPRGEAVVSVTIPAPLERIQSIAVTDEPAPGSPSPTGPPLLQWASQQPPVEGEP